jgi:hypothetical protein
MIEDASDEQRDKIVTNAGKLLFFLVTDLPNKLRLAERRRLTLQAQIERGERPKGDPRFEFVMKTSSNIFGWLSNKSKEYDIDNPHDMLTANDLMDILKIAQFKLAEHLKKDRERRAAPPKPPTSAS